MSKSLAGADANTEAEQSFRKSLERPEFSRQRYEAGMSLFVASGLTVLLGLAVAIRKPNNQPIAITAIAVISTLLCAIGMIISEGRYQFAVTVGTVMGVMLSQWWTQLRRIGSLDSQCETPSDPMLPPAPK